LTGTRGRVWQYTAIDVASSFVWGEVHVTPLNPAARFTTALVQRVARDLAAAGWKLRAVSTDNGSEFRAAPFTSAVHQLGASHRFIRAGRPQTNGCVERVQRTISKSAGARPSRDRWCRSLRRSAETSTVTCTSTTSNAPRLVCGAAARRLAKAFAFGPLKRGTHKAVSDPSTARARIDPKGS
jgi:transposase InsO family protein